MGRLDLKLSLLLILSTAILSTALPLLQAREPIHLQHRWEVEPPLGASWIYVAPEQSVTIDPSRFRSLQRQIRVSEAQKAIQFASEREIGGREEALLAIIQRLKAGEENRQALLALASAAIALSDGQEADLLWRLLRDDEAARRVIESALVRWKCPAALDLWRIRLADSRAQNLDLLTAIEGIGAMGNASDRTALEAILRSDRTAAPVKLVVARALGNVASEGLEMLADAVLTTNIEQRELMAAELVARHTSEAAHRLRMRIIDSDNFAARLRAFNSIAEHQLKRARELAEQMIVQPDSTLRLQAVQVFNQFEDAASLRQQGAALQDKNLNVRSTVRENLELKARNSELRPVVDEVVDYQLSGESYQGIEQAILLAVALQDKNHCPQFVSLLQHPRPEVSLTAGWALQELADTPDVLDAMYRHSLEVTDRLVNSDPVLVTDTFRLAYLFEALGRNRYRAARETLKLYIPKDGHRMGDVARTSAIWALGKIEQGRQDEGLARQLAQRLLDASEIDPEDENVKFASAIAMGYIGAPTSREQLNKAPDEPPSPIGLARVWALEQFAKAP